ncbi:hypothetical protein EVAR_68399_1 [Eumeta japonica]|uniref:Uncharacterized protein n=1 Tax=Eumeta variegata TaxID=151549 RepID=A0A4C2ABW8_EUMVA|nr:hypothetical protein EVAR_68399_1 [Eumeta japonica]
MKKDPTSLRSSWMDVTGSLGFEMFDIGCRLEVGVGHTRTAYVVDDTCPLFVVPRGLPAMAGRPRGGTMATFLYPFRPTRSFITPEAT